MRQEDLAAEGDGALPTLVEELNQTVVPQLYRSLRLADVAFHVANEGRRFVGCDRLCVAHCRTAQPVLLAVSGVASIERRAKQVRSLETLLAAVVRGRQAVHYPQSVELPPQIDHPLQAYLDASQCQELHILPVLADAQPAEPAVPAAGECLAVLVFENFSRVTDAEQELRRQWLWQYAAPALRHATEFESLPLLGVVLPLQKLLRGYRRGKLRVWAVALTFAVLLLLAAVVPAELQVTAKGTLQPQALRHIYAPLNGEIVEVRARHRDTVHAGQPLMLLRSRESELKKEELLTQRAITQERLRSIEAARLLDRRPSGSDAESGRDLSAGQRELMETLASQDKQLALLDELLDSLTLTSPIDGTVASWKPGENLERRPVQQGQKLMSVAQLDGPGMLELRVLDEDIRYVQAAVATRGEPLPVRFVIASDPGHQHMGTVSQIGTIAETLNDSGASVRVSVTVAPQELQRAIPGATVNARIACGRAAIGYVWTRRLWDWLRMHWP